MRSIRTSGGLTAAVLVLAATGACGPSSRSASSTTLGQSADPPSSATGSASVSEQTKPVLSTSPPPVSHGALVDGNGYLLGGIRDGTFIPASQAARYAKPGARYDVYGSTGLKGRTVGERAVPSDDICTPGYFVKLAPRIGVRVASTLGVASIPRRVTQKKKPNAAISREVTRVLRGKGVRTPVSIKQVISVDLDGDGKTEDVVKAERLLYTNGSITPTVRAGDYSMVAVLRGGKLIKTLGANFFPRANQFDAPQTFTIAAVADFNQDGRFEVAVSSRYYEGSATTVTSSTSSGLKKVLAADCGA